MTKDKIAYVEALLYNYKKNKARVRIWELGLISDEDFVLGSIDYSSDRVQTSNLSSLDNKIIARQREMGKLKKDIIRTDEMLGILKERDRLVVTSFYIDRLPIRKIKYMIDRDDDKTVWRIKREALENMADLIWNRGQLWLIDIRLSLLR